MRLSRIVRIFAALAAVPVITSGRTASAQGEVRHVSLAEVRRAALKNGVAVAAARATERSLAARALSIRGDFDTSVGTGLTARSNTMPGVSDSDFVAGFDRRVAGQVRAARALETGGTFSVALGQQRTETSIATQGGTQEGRTTFDPTTSATLVHPLLRGFGIGPTLAPRRAIDERSRSASALRAQAQLDAELEAVIAYARLVQARAERRVRRDGIATNREQLTLVRALVASGRAAVGDVAAVERSLRMREADETVLDAEVALRSAELLRAMGGSPRDILETEVVPADPLPPPEPRASAELAARALAKNPLLVAARAELSAAGYDARFAASQSLVRLDLTAAVSLVGRERSLPASTGQLLSGHAPGYFVGLDLSIPLGNRTARGNEAAANAEVDRRSAELRDRERELCVALAGAIAAERAAAERVALASSAEAAAESTLRLEEDRMLAGRSSTSDVLLRQQELFDTRLVAIRARTDVAIAGAAIAVLSVASESELQAP